MKPIGGFFELEPAHGDRPLHAAALALTSGRSCLNFLLRSVRPSRVHAPFYTCDAVLSTLALNGVPVVLYGLDERLEPAEHTALEHGEFFLYINYFGLKQDCVHRLQRAHSGRLIVDNTQAFFERGSRQTWSFNSARKWFGVPDGGYLYGPSHEVPWAAPAPNETIRADHLLNRRAGNTHLAYKQYLESEAEITADIRGMSLFSSRILGGVDYAAVAQRRRANYHAYARSLDRVNLLQLPLAEGAVPFFYPLLAHADVDRQAFHARQIFVPELWSDVVRREGAGYAFDRELAARIVPLPVDHRYNDDDCERVLRAAHELVG